MRMGSRLAGFALASLVSGVIGACATPLETPSPRITVGGSSPLVDMFTRVGDETGIPPELLATLSYVETRLRVVDSEEHGQSTIGLLGLSAEDLARGARLAGVTDMAARTDAEASLRAGAALIREQAPAARTLEEFLAVLEPSLRRELVTTLARGVSGQDVLGESVVIAARPSLDRNAGFGTTTQALGAADYAPAKWVSASTSNFAVGNRGLTDISHIVVHTTQGAYNGTISWFKDPAAKVSAHYVIKSSNGEITQMVKEKDVAWHDKCFNANTVGIEHEGFVENPTVWYTEAMYAESAKLSAYLADKYNVPKTHEFILGHGDAPDCSTHTDPGPGWNWDTYLDLVNTGGAQMFGAGDVVVDAPESMTSGDRATVTIQVTNNGNVAWDLDLTRLGTTSPANRESAFFADGDWMSPSRATGADARVEPGETGTFTFEIVAPTVREATLYDEAFQLVQEDVTWFGPEAHVMVQVMPKLEPEAGGCSAAGGAGSGGTACAMLLLGAVAGRRRRRADRRRRL
ncbi:MAG: amidase [Myxococcales bacterium]|nr:amidase [Myxococcales bacterium]